MGWLLQEKMNASEAPKSRFAADGSITEIQADLIKKILWAGGPGKLQAELIELILDAEDFEEITEDLSEKLNRTKKKGCKNANNCKVQD